MIYNYYGIGNCECRCDIEIYGALVIVTELKDNPGTSITNWAEHLATKICRDNNIDMKSLVWVEHYPEEDYDLVTFEIENEAVNKKVFKSPKWQHITQEYVEDLIKEHNKTIS